MTDDIITYVETAWNGRRIFQLHADRIVVEFKLPHTHGEATIRLADLRPMPDKFYGRPSPIRWGLLSLALSIPFGVIAVAIPQFRLEVMTAIVIPLAFIGLVITCYCLRKMEYARFPSHQGIVLLDVGCWSRNKNSFRSFVEELSRRIAAAQPGVNPEK